MNFLTRVQLATGTEPFDKFSKWLDEINVYMGKIGPAVAGIAIAIAVLYICLGDERKVKENFKKIIVAVIAVSLLSNVTNLLSWGSSIVQYFLK